jgi:Fic family protein
MGNQFNIEYQLNRICNIINKAPFPPTKALLTLVLIAYLQAFADGNKRTSRTTANALLMAYDYCPLSYGSLNEGEYNKAIVLFYEQNNLSYFKKLFIEQFEFAVGNYWL